MTSDEIAALCARAFPEGARIWSAEEIERTRTVQGGVFLVEGGAVALGRVAAGEAELYLIATDPDARRQGHAASCLVAFEAACRDAGAALVNLELGASNRPALALYSQSGYERIGERPSYYTRSDGTRETAILMQKRL